MGVGHTRCSRTAPLRVITIARTQIDPPRWCRRCSSPPPGRPSPSTRAASPTARGATACTTRPEGATARSRPASGRTCSAEATRARCASTATRRPGCPGPRVHFVSTVHVRPHLRQAAPKQLGPGRRLRLAEEDLHAGPRAGRGRAREPGRAARPQHRGLRVRLPARRPPRHGARAGPIPAPASPARAATTPTAATAASPAATIVTTGAPDRRQRLLRRAAPSRWPASGRVGVYRLLGGVGYRPPSLPAGWPSRTPRPTPFRPRRLQPHRDRDPDAGGLRPGHERVVRQLPPRACSRASVTEQMDGLRHPVGQRGQAPRLLPDQLHRLREDRAASPTPTSPAPTCRSCPSRRARATTPR